MTSGTEVRSRVWLTPAIVVLAVLVPFAEFFALRLQVRAETVIQSLGMPWPAPVANVVQGVSVAVIVATAVGSIFGIVRRGSSRTAGIVAIIVTLVVAVPVFVVVMVLTWGDPA